MERRFRRFFSNLGPGLITGAADDDPSGISTYSVTGAAFGYTPLWTALFSFPLMAAGVLIRSLTAEIAEYAEKFKKILKSFSVHSAVSAVNLQFDL